jgi:hypothetical protein
MKVKVKNLGPIKQAEYEVADFTIICGMNNTGKTYITYALYGFFDYWKTGFKFPFKGINKLLEEGQLSINLIEYKEKITEILKQASKKYQKFLDRVFAAKEGTFDNTKFELSVEQSQIDLFAISYQRTISLAKTELIGIFKDKKENLLKINLLTDTKSLDVPKELLHNLIGDALKEILFGKIIPRVFIASAERTGAAIFRKDLDSARNRLIEQIGEKKAKIDIFSLIENVSESYALPVRDNVDFTRRLEDIAKTQSVLAKKYPELLAEFADIIGGEYRIVRDELVFVPENNKRIRLPMGQSSSAVRSLLDIGFYLHHIARPGDMLMIDEPELNLHPENQRRIARLLSRLVNIGIKVFITTHSDYIIKELNTLIMLNQPDTQIQKIREAEGYREDELINPNKIKVYMAKKNKILLDGNKRKTSVLTLVEADIDPSLGIEAETFDKTIEDMNRIQDAIIFSGN